MIAPNPIISILLACFEFLISEQKGGGGGQRVFSLHLISKNTPKTEFERLLQTRFI